MQTEAAEKNCELGDDDQSNGTDIIANLHTWNQFRFKLEYG